MNWVKIFFIALLFNGYNSFSQDTLIMLNGKKKLVEFEGTEGSFIWYSKVGSDKVKEKKDLRIFAVGTDSGRVYCYQQDTMYGDDFTIEQMSMHVKGMEDARDYYKDKKVVLVGVPVGAASGFLGIWWGTLGPIFYSLGVGTSELPIDKIKTSDEKLLLDNFYVEGYRRAVTDMKVRQAFVSSFSSLIATVVTASLILKEEE